MTAQNLLADQILRIADSMVHFIESTKDDVLDWRPAITGSAESRSVLEMSAECIAVNLRFTARLEGNDDPQIAEPKLVLAAEATQAVQSSAAALAATVRTLSNEAFATEYEHKGKWIPASDLIVGAYRNMAYHIGQINLIQLLQGDPTFHRPPSW